MSTQPRTGERGPFRAEHLHEGDRYELSDGHAIYCAPSGREHAGRTVSGALVLDTDPAVEWSGMDAGFSPEPGTMRAPDVAVAPPGPEIGFIPGVPRLAVEYAGPGQDLADLRVKIAELLDHGTQQVWVVHLVGPRRVDVHTPGAPPRRCVPGDLLTAPGILQNPVPVVALYDREASHQAVLRNLLQRAGYSDLDAVRDEGRAEGREEGREEGLAAGVGQGQRTQTLALVLGLLRRRIGEPAADIATRLAALPLPRIEALSLDLLDFTSAADLDDWLVGEGGEECP